MIDDRPITAQVQAFHHSAPYSLVIYDLKDEAEFQHVLAAVNAALRKQMTDRREIPTIKLVKWTDGRTFKPRGFVRYMSALRHFCRPK